MDPLSTVLALLRPTTFLTAALDAGGDWAIRFETPPATIKCYAVTHGTCWFSIAGLGAPPGRRATGDCFVIASACAFTLASDTRLTPLPARDVLGGAGNGGLVTVNGGGRTTFAGARFDMEDRRANALLDALPPVIHLQAAPDQAALRWSIERLMVELCENRPGASLAAHHLAHLMLLQALRLHVVRQADARVGWFHALGDPRLGPVIGAIHADPARRWTLGELAAAAGMSRSIFAQRFRRKVGQTPIGYLTRWRILLAADRLASGREPIARVAQASGYASENAFSTAFKRIMGCSPGRYGRPVGAAT